MRKLKIPQLKLKLFSNIFKKWRKNLMPYAWWELLIFIIGSVSFITILVVLFIPIAGGPNEFKMTSSVPAVGTSEFLRTLSDSLNLPQKQGNTPQILNNGDEFLPALLSDIDNAHTSINIMLYIWDAGTMSDQVFQHLDAKLKEGVQVRIMVDGIGGLRALKRKEFKTFKDLGGKAEAYHSFSIAPWNLIHSHKRNHRRAIIIDRTVGYIGGMAIGDKWLGDARNEKEWRDMMFRVTGPMTLDIQGFFAELWGSATGELLVGPNFFPLAGNKATDAHTVTYIPLGSTPSSNSLTLQKFILLSLAGAQRKIYISNPYFLPDQTFRDILISKAKAGADVRVLLPNHFNDSKEVRYASQKYYEELLVGGVKIYEYQPTFIHTKSMVLDGEWSVIGSANMDNRSRKLNEEDMFGISDKAFGAQIENVFMSDLVKAKQVELSDWQNRGLWQRAREYFALKFIQQY